MSLNFNLPVARAIQVLAKFHVIAAADDEERNSLGLSRERLRAPAHLALHVLGYSDLVLDDILQSANGFGQLAARIHVDHGAHYLEMLYFWFDFQSLLSVANGARNTGTSGSLGFIIEPMLDSLHVLGLLDELPPELRTVLAAAAQAPRLSAKNALKLRAALLQNLEPLVTTHLGLGEHFRSGKVTASDIDIDYSTVYRLARLLGSLRADALIATPDDKDSHEWHRKRFELQSALERLGVRKAIPNELVGVCRAFKLLTEDDLGTRDEHASDAWMCIDSYLRTKFGGLSDHVYRISYETECLTRALGHPKQLSFLMKGSLHHLRKELIAVEAKKVVSRLGSTDDLLKISGKRKGARDLAAAAIKSAVNTWLDDVLPLEPEGGVKVARITLSLNRFRSYWTPIDEGRIGAFINQFPSSLRWLGEDLLGLVDFYDESFFSQAISSTISDRRLVASGTTSLCLLGGARKSASLISYILDRRLHLPYQELREAIRDPKTTSILFADDCSLSGTQAIHVFSELLGIWHKEHKYSAALTREDALALRQKKIIVLAALGTEIAKRRVSQFFDTQEIQHELVFVRNVPVLSAAGQEAIQSNQLWGSGDGVTDPVRHLADPIFSPFSRLSRPEEWETARDFAADVGFSLLERRSREKNWSDARRRKSGLGFSGLQGRLVFSHNVPKSTLTMLWESGSFRGKRWVPLFPSRE